MQLRPRQQIFRDKCVEALNAEGNTLGVAPTGAGKCLGIGTPVLMFDGSIKPVEEVSVGDLLMGPDSKPRRVLSTTSGWGPLYKVTPKKGDAYVVNDAHILSLKITRGATKWDCSRSDTYQAGKIHNITVLDYLSRSKTFRHCAKGWRTGVEFKPKELPIPPYILGVWLGDGSSLNPCIYTADPEIAAEWANYAFALGLATRIEYQPNNASVGIHITHGLRGEPNALRDALRSLGVMGNKHVPLQYLSTSRKDRLELLAGIVDTDGCVSRGGFDIVFKSEQLARDTAHLARSLGLAAYVTAAKKTCGNNGVKGDYHRISISGDCSVVPTRLSRKKAPARAIKKDALLVGLSVDAIGHGAYFGFEIDGDRLFMLGDFTVTHNTVMLSAIAGEYVNKGAAGLVIQHRDELVDQNRKTFEKVNPRASTGLFTATRKEWGYGCTFAMIQTLAGERNLDGMPPLDFIAVDEGHHAVADSYMKVLHTAKQRNPNVKLLLVTATPNRGDKKALRGVVSNVADQITLKELIEGRFLVRPRTLVVDIGVQEELRGVRKTIVDFDMTAVEAIMDKEVLNDKVIEAWAEHAGDRQTVVFCSTVAHAQHVAEAFSAAGIRAATVEGKMTAAARRETLAAYDRGEIQVITNVAVLTEGWDHQPTSCVILLRPSSFKSTMIQMIGRGLRKVDPERYPGVIKDDCVILDFGTSILTHGSIEQEVDLDQKGIKECPECNATVPAQSRECAICGYEWPRDEDMAAAVNVALGGGGEGEPKAKGSLDNFIMTEVDLLADSPFRYETLFDGIVSIASALDAWAVVVSYHGHWHAIGGGKDIGIRHLCDSRDRLLSMAAADDFLRETGDAEMANKTKRWMSQAPSDKQLEILRLTPMAAMGMTKYLATCLIQWKFSESAIRRVLERASSARMAA